MHIALIYLVRFWVDLILKVDINLNIMSATTHSYELFSKDNFYEKCTAAFWLLKLFGKGIHVSAAIFGPQIYIFCR